MIDINASDFVKSFDMKKGTVGLVGHGFVGKAVHEFFKGKCNVVVHDKAMSEFQSLNEVVAQSDIIFMCVPTPMRKDGSCYTGFIEEVIKNIKDSASTQNRNLDSFVVIIKSTVYPGFTEEMQDKYLPMRIVFSPEFLTEKNSVEDFKKVSRVIIGGDEDDALVVLKFFEGADPKMLEEGKRLLLQCDPTTAEMVKLYTNGILMTKVLFSNEIYQICQKIGVTYEEVRMLACIDPRIGSSHTLVPGPDGSLASGGHCFPKDINNLRAFCKLIDVKEKLFTAVIERNDELREKKDWEEMKERAVTDN
jgi:UDPglucose 6-dehydrogenase